MHRQASHASLRGGVQGEVSPQRQRNESPSSGGPNVKPVLLDLFCGQGGAGKGYHDAGFEVVGVDILSLVTLLGLCKLTRFSST